MRRGTIGSWLCIVPLLLHCGDAEPRGDGTMERAESARPPVAAGEWEALVAAEEVIHALATPLREVERSIRNLALPDPHARDRFAAAVAAVDLAATAVGEAEVAAAPPNAVRRLPGVSATRSPWPLAPAAAPRAVPELDLWRPFFATLHHVEHVELGVAAGAFGDAARRRFDSELVIAGRARRADGDLVAFRARVDVEWQRRPDAEERSEDAWLVSAWRTRAFDLQVAPAPIYREVLDAVLPDRATRERARTSLHEQRVVERLQDPEGFEPPHPHFFVGSQDRHPGLAVTDVNADGLDDLYAMARWGPNQLFVSRGDGGFDERAAQWGLDLRDHGAAAIFADFDNDGDPDAFVGRTLEASVYLENLGGRFLARPDAVEGGAPTLVSSLAAADYDGDGLLDLYVSTYAAQMVVAEMLRAEKARRQTGRRPERRLLAEHLAPADAEALWQHTKQAEAHEFLALPGPPNVLLRNVGDGRFAPTALDGPARAFRNTYQATWADYDDDGDADLYLAHDFSPNQLLRNEGGGVFRDVTEESGTADIGFGMGASWGDYDGDGREDLYVSNMYSKAGRRVTSGLAGVDERLGKMARGNTLFRNAGERFEHVSGLEPPKLLVEAAGWAWGGQFVDVDNDGHLDIAVLSGYYTAPREVESLVDI